MAKKNKPKLNPTLFWDTDFQSLDFKKHKKFIIIRVLTHGDLDDFKRIKKFYGKQEIIRAVRQAKYLDKKTLNFFSLIFDIPKKEFLCSKKSSIKIQKIFWDR